MKYLTGSAEMSRAGYMTSINSRARSSQDYQCTPGTNRSSRLTGLGIPTRVTARAGRFGHRRTGRECSCGVSAAPAGEIPRAAAESG